MLVQSTGMQSYNNFVQPQNSIKTTKSEVKNNNDTKLMPYSANYYMPIAFGRRKKTNEEIINNIGEENFPNAQILENFRTQKNKSLYEIHKEYYASLLECETLDEAKELYPEFEGVLDAKDINLKELPCNNLLHKISKCEIEGINLENLSLELLKRYYAQVKPLSNSQNYWNISMTQLYQQILPLLNIKKLGNKYGKSMVQSNPVSKQQIREIMYGVYESEKGDKLRATARKTLQKNKENPYFIEKQNKSVTTDEFREKIRQIHKENEKSQKMYELSYLSTKLSYFYNPEIRNTMSELSKEYFDFAELLRKQEDGTISNQEINILKKYFKNCEEAMPEYQKEIIGPSISLIYQELTEKIQKAKDKSATDEDLTILSSYYLLTKAQAPEYLDCFAEVEDTLLENEDTFSEAVNIMSDYYKYIQEKYPKEIVEKYFSRLEEVLKSSKELKVC